MGQEQSYSHASTVNSFDYDTSHRRSQSNQLDYHPRSQDNTYQTHKPPLKGRRSTDSFKSDHSDKSSGYRSSSTCECQTDYYCTSLYKNDHYKNININKELYKPVKIPKEKRYKLQLFDLQKDELKSARLKSYCEEKFATGTSQKKTGIRNYTPKILEQEQRKKIEYTQS